MSILLDRYAKTMDCALGQPVDLPAPSMAHRGPRIELGPRFGEMCTMHAPWADQPCARLPFTSAPIS